MSGIKRLAAAGAAVLGIRLLALLGTGAAVENWLDTVSEDGRVVSASVSLELGRRDGGEAAEASPEEDAPESTAGPTPYTSAAPAAASAAEEAADGSILETTIYGGLTVKNATDYIIDTAALVSAGPSQTLPSEGPQILIIHTHGSEAYAQTGSARYAESDTSRTQDKEYSVIKVGDELTSALEAQGLTVLHDREIYDYPSYTGSYSRSGAAVEAYLAQYPNIAVVIDLHRDALTDGEVTYKTVAELDGTASSQVMFVVGTDASGLTHPYWEQNLRLALYLQQAMNSKYPTLARPVSVVCERYNQHLTTGSLILEVGSSGNTLQEAITAVRLFADAAGPALLKLVA